MPPSPDDHPAKAELTWLCTEQPPAGADAGSSECLPVDTVLALLEGDLSPSEREAAEAHMDECGACQAMLTEAARDSGGQSPLPSSSSRNGSLPRGTKVAERYRVERFIARGGMGEIYEVRDLVLDESIALKTLTATAVDTPKAALRLKAEVKLSRRVGNPNTCRIFDFGEHSLHPMGSTIHFFTMELVEGQSLGSHIRGGGRLARARVLEIARQLIDGLTAAHAAGVLHRDFKSDNVMLRLDDSGQVSDRAVIMDFGLARALHEEGDRLTSHTQALMGSAAYMAPEQVEGATLTEAADLYAYGVVLFEMLTGELPFRGSSPMATALARLRRPAPKPTHVVPELDPAWDDLVLGCLQREPNKRYDAATVREELAALDDRPQRGARRSRRRKSRTFAALLGGTAAGALIGFGGARFTRSPPPPDRVSASLRPAQAARAEASAVPVAEAAPQAADKAAVPAAAGSGPVRQQQASAGALLEAAVAHRRLWQLTGAPEDCRAARGFAARFLAEAPDAPRRADAARTLAAVDRCEPATPPAKATGYAPSNPHEIRLRARAKPPTVSAGVAPTPAARAVANAGAKRGEGPPAQARPTRPSEDRWEGLMPLEPRAR